MASSHWFVERRVRQQRVLSFDIFRGRVANAPGSCNFPRERGHARTFLMFLESRFLVIALSLWATFGGQVMSIAPTRCFVIARAGVSPKKCAWAHGAGGVVRSR